MTEIHDLARSFDSLADEYEAGRPGYPEEAIDFLSDKFGIGPRTTVLDIAAGTGKLTRAFLGTGAELIAIEPLPEMLRVLQSNLPSVKAIRGVAEALPLEDSSVQVAVVGQAFHWFDAEAAVGEMGRVLSNPGGVALIWNMRDSSSTPWAQAVQSILSRYEVHFATRSGTRRSVAFNSHGGFQRLRKQIFPNPQLLTAERLVARVKSASYIGSLPEAERELVLNEVRRIALEHPDLKGRKTFELPYVTEVYWTSFKN